MGAPRPILAVPLLALVATGAWFGAAALVDLVDGGGSAQARAYDRAVSTTADPLAELSPRGLTRCRGAEAVPSDGGDICFRGPLEPVAAASELVRALRAVGATDVQPACVAHRKAGPMCHVKGVISGHPIIVRVTRNQPRATATAEDSGTLAVGGLAEWVTFFPLPSTSPIPVPA